MTTDIERPRGGKLPTLLHELKTTKNGSLLGDVSWGDDVNSEVLFEAEKIAARMTGWVGSERRKQDSNAAIIKSNDIIDHYLRLVQSDTASLPEEEDPTNYTALFNQITLDKDLYSDIDQPETKMWEITIQAFRTIFYFGTQYSVSLTKKFRRIEECLVRVESLLKKTKLHSVELSDLLNPVIRMASRIAQRPSVDDLLNTINQNIETADLKSRKLLKESEQFSSSGDMDFAHSKLVERADNLYGIVVLFSLIFFFFDVIIFNKIKIKKTEIVSSELSKYPFIEKEKSDFLKAEGKTVDDICKMQRLDIDKLKLLNKSLIQRIEDDTKALNNKMSELCDWSLVEEKSHQSWINECNNNLRTLQLKVGDSWDIIHTQELKLKSYAQQRTSLVTEKISRCREFQQKKQTFESCHGQYTKRRSLLRLNKEAHQINKTLYNTCGSILDEMNNEIQRFIKEMDKELNDTRDDVDLKYDNAFRSYYSQVMDLSHRKEKFISTLQKRHEYETTKKEAADAIFSPESRRHVDNMKEIDKTITTISTENRDLKKRAQAALTIYNESAGPRLSLLEGYVHPSEEVEEDRKEKQRRMSQLLQEEEEEEDDANILSNSE